MSRRIRNGRGRKAFEYKLKSPKIEIDMDIESFIRKKPSADSKPTALFSILYTLLSKSRRVLGHSVDDFINSRFDNLGNGEKHIVMNSLMFDGDLEDAKNFFLKSLNGRGLTEERSMDVVSVLEELIDMLIELYEEREGHYSTESLIDVTMVKVIRVLGDDLFEEGSILSTLPSVYFGKWET